MTSGSTGSSRPRCTYTDPVKFAALNENALAKIKAYRYDRIVEKHEGPARWVDVLNYYSPEFLRVEGNWVLLPLPAEHHKNVTVLRTALDKEKQILVLFLKDTTYVEKTEDELFMAGFVAICEKVTGEPFFIATLYHEWFIL